jgi:hypothetical protein
MTEIWGIHAAMDMVMSQCIEECLKCHRTCVDTATQCTLIGGDYADAERLRSLSDCAQICETSADFMLRRSEFQAQICELCADLCDRCADACAELEYDRMMKRCEQACRRAAILCREVVGSLV